MRDRVRHVAPLERLHCLKAVASFGDLAPPDLHVLAQNAVERFFPKRRQILAEDTPVTAVHLVVEGQVALRRRGRDVRIIGPGEGVGLLELLAGAADGPEAVAATEVLTLSFATEALLDVLEDHFSILHHLLRELSAMRIAQRRQLGVAAGGVRSSQGHPPPPPVPGAPGGRARELDLAELIMFMRRSLPFARGSIAALAELAHHVAEVRIERGARLWSEGDEAPDFLMVVDGSVLCTVGDGEQTFRFGVEGTPGSLEALADTRRWFTAEAEEPVHALRLDAEHLIDVFEDHFEMAMEYLSILARQTAHTLEQEAPAAA